MILLFKGTVQNGVAAPDPGPEEGGLVTMSPLLWLAEKPGQPAPEKAASFALTGRQGLSVLAWCVQGITRVPFFMLRV